MSEAVQVVLITGFFNVLCTIIKVVFKEKD